MLDKKTSGPSPCRVSTHHILVHRRMTSKFEAVLWRVCLTLLSRIAFRIAFLRSAVITCSLR